MTMGGMDGSAGGAPRRTANQRAIGAPRSDIVASSMSRLCASALRTFMIASAIVAPKNSAPLACTQPKTSACSSKPKRARYCIIATMVAKIMNTMAVASATPSRPHSRWAGVRPDATNQVCATK